LKHHHLPNFFLTKERHTICWRWSYGNIDWVLSWSSSVTSDNCCDRSQLLFP